MILFTSVRVDRSLFSVLTGFCILLAAGLSSRSAESDWERLTAESFELYQAGLFEEAIGASRRALAASEAEFGPDHVVTAKSMNNLGAMLSKHGDRTEAEMLLLSALEILERKLGKYDPGASSALNNLGELYSAQERFEEAEPLLKRALSIREKEPGEKDADLIATLENLAVLYSRMDRFDEAERIYSELLKIRLEALGKGHPDTEATVRSILNLKIGEGNYHKSRKDHEKAEAAYETALDIARMLSPSDPTQVASLLEALAAIDVRTGDLDEAAFNYERLAEVRAEIHGAESVEHGLALRDLARIHVRRGDFESAVEQYDPSADILAGRLEADDPELLQTRAEQAAAVESLASSWLKDGRNAEAAGLYERAIETRHSAGECDDPSLAIRMNNLAGLFVKIEEFDKAEGYYRKALEILKAAVGDSQADYLLVLANLGQMYAITGETEKAAEIDSLLIPE
jgi:tetratricopeptide (TPR) repeat protein